MSCYDGKMMNSKIPERQTSSRLIRIPGFIICRYLILAAVFVMLCFNGHGICGSQEKSSLFVSATSNGMRMTRAVICEDIRDGQPFNEGIIFSSDLGKITCFTEFDSIIEKTTIYHCWYFRDNLRAKKKPLVLNPPKWSTFSQIEPRETDKGPWRVEITDGTGNILQTLRFSIID
jgi:hypothetical protein